MTERPLNSLIPITCPLLFWTVFCAKFARPRMPKIRPFPARKNLFFLLLLRIRLIVSLKFFVEQHTYSSYRCSSPNKNYNI